MRGQKAKLCPLFSRNLMNELMINLNTKLKTPLYEQIYEYIKKEICDGNIACGEKLPSTRSLAQFLEVSRSTVELAYEQLLSEGYIESFPCKGFFVAQLEGLYRQVTWKEPERKIIKSEKKYRYDFSPNGIDLQSFPYNVWRKLSKEVLLDDQSELFRSGNVQGEESLRYAIQNYLHQARGVKCDIEQIIVGAGNEYLLMLLEMILGKDYTIAFENPTYKQAYRLFNNLSFEIQSVDMDKNGIRIDRLEESGANLAYVMPSHQYPLGIVMPIKRRLELLKWATESEDRYIIEDDYDSEFRYKGKPIPALQGYDANDKVIYLGTFSRAVAPAIRISYMVLPKSLIVRYKEQCGFLSCTVPKMDQYVVKEFILQGHFERHLNKMRALYKTRHDVLLNQLKPISKICRITGEHAGVHLLLHFDSKCSEHKLVELAKERDIKVYGLSEYYIERTDSKDTVIILGYANMCEEDIIHATQQLCEAWKEI